MSDYVANFLPGQAVTYVAGGTITGGQVVVLSATGRVVTVAGAGARNTVGLACQDVVSGQAVTVTRGGEQRPIASGAITAGALVKSAAAGAVAAFVPGTDAIDLILGVALTTVADAAPVDVAWRA